MLEQVESAQGISNGVRIRDLPGSERPRERLMALGAGSLSSTELLGFVAWVGLATVQCAGVGASGAWLMSGVSKGSPGSHTRTGVGRGKAARVSAALELSVRLATLPNQPLAIRRTADVAALLRPRLSRLSHECFVVLALDAGHRVLRVVEMYRGTASSTASRVAELFRPAAACDALAILLVQNHPSGNPEPSLEDIAVTRRAVAAGRLLSIEGVDHVIITSTHYASIRARGVGFE